MCYLDPRIDRVASRTCHRLARRLARMAIALTLLASGCSSAGETSRAGTGFFRLVVADGAYWLVDPEGQRFLSLGVNHIDDHSFRAPDDSYYDPVPSAFEGDAAAWRRSVAERLRSWGFNTVGAWSDEGLREQGLAYTTMLHLAPCERDEPCLDRVFDPAFADRVRKRARAVATLKDDPDLLGHFLDNELPWYGEKAWPEPGQESLLQRYARLPSGDPNKCALVGFLEDRYEGIDAFNDAWGTNLGSFADLEALPTPGNGVRQADADAWAAHVADRYCALAARAVRDADPNHLLLGVRFAAVPPPGVAESCGRHNDVVSINHYSESGYVGRPLLERVHRESGRPLLVSEYSYRARENRSGSPNRLGPDVTVETQVQRAEYAARFAGGALALPYVVGLHWFEWADQPPGGRFDGQDSNFGLVDIHDRPYEALVGALAEVHARAERLHAGAGEEGVTGAPPGPSPP